MKKVVAIGDTNLGKSAFFQWALDPKLRYATYKGVPTLGVEVHPIVLPNGKAISLWDCGGKFRGIEDGYYILGECVVVFHSPKDSENWLKHFRRVCEDAPVIHVGARCDELSEGEKTLLQEKYPNIIFISNKTGEGREDLIKALENI